jgi:predicted RNA-binding protein with PUA domain
LKDKFRVKFDKYKPDYFMYEVFGNEYLNKEYNNSIKIAIITENKIPDFNEADYAIIQAHIIIIF